MYNKLITPFDIYLHLYVHVLSLMPHLCFPACVHLPLLLLMFTCVCICSYFYPHHVLTCVYFYWCSFMFTSIHLYLCIHVHQYSPVAVFSYVYSLGFTSLYSPVSLCIPDLCAPIFLYGNLSLLCFHLYSKHFHLCSPVIVCYYWSCCLVLVFTLLHNTYVFIFVNLYLPLFTVSFSVPVSTYVHTYICTPVFTCVDVLLFPPVFMCVIMCSCVFICLCVYQCYQYSIIMFTV